MTTNQSIRDAVGGETAAACPACGYPAVGRGRVVCPECGHTFDTAHASRLQSWRFWLARTSATAAALSFVWTAVIVFSRMLEHRPVAAVSVGVLGFAVVQLFRFAIMTRRKVLSPRRAVTLFLMHLAVFAAWMPISYAAIVLLVFALHAMAAIGR